MTRRVKAIMPKLLNNIEKKILGIVSDGLTSFCDIQSILASNTDAGTDVKMKMLVGSAISHRKALTDDIVHSKFSIKNLEDNLLKARNECYQAYLAVVQVRDEKDTVSFRNSANNQEELGELKKELNLRSKLYKERWGDWGDAFRNYKRAIKDYTDTALISLSSRYEQWKNMMSDLTDYEKSLKPQVMPEEDLKSILEGLVKEKFIKKIIYANQNEEKIEEFYIMDKLGKSVLADMGTPSQDIRMTRINSYHLSHEIKVCHVLRRIRRLSSYFDLEYSVLDETCLKKMNSKQTQYPDLRYDFSIPDGSRIQPLYVEIDNGTEEPRQLFNKIRGHENVTFIICNTPKRIERVSRSFKQFMNEDPEEAGYPKILFGLYEDFLLYGFWARWSMIADDDKPPEESFNFYHICGGDNMYLRLQELAKEEEGRKMLIFKTAQLIKEFKEVFVQSAHKFIPEESLEDIFVTLARDFHEKITGFKFMALEKQKKKPNAAFRLTEVFIEDVDVALVLK